jgi:hypothetical protein
MRRARRQTFIICLRPEPRVEPVRALRGALKSLLRRHGLRALTVRPATPDECVTNVRRKGGPHDCARHRVPAARAVHRPR